MKRAVLKIMRYGGAFAPFRAFNRHQALILNYHRFSELEDRRSVTRQSFAKQLEYLKAHYSVMPLSAIARRFQGAEPLPAGAAAITIDDGFADAYRVAYPLLKAHRLPATVFVVTDFLDGRTWLWTDKVRYLTCHSPVTTATVQVEGHRLQLNWDGRSSRLDAAARLNAILKTLPDRTKDIAIQQIARSVGVKIPELPPAEYAALSWNQVSEMEAADIEIGSHTVTHPILTNTSDEQLDFELRQSRSRLEEILGHPIQLFCYPNGSFDERVRSATFKAGYECAVTTLPGLNNSQSDPLALRRLPAELDMDHFVQATSGFEQFKTRLLHVNSPNPITAEISEAE